VVRDLAKNIPWLNRVVKAETGLENVERFIKEVTELSQENQFIVMYRMPQKQGMRTQQGWEWMAHEDWRAAVLRHFESITGDTPIMDFKFYPPGPLGDWVFHAVSAATITYVQTLTLTDSLEAA